METQHVKPPNRTDDFTDADILKVRKTYYAMCAETDFLLGRVLDALRDSGQYDNTYIVFVSDHGKCVNNVNIDHSSLFTLKHRGRT